jgi:ketosteroid isomerase-like protein
MSQENVEARKLDMGLIREIYDHWNRGEVEATLAHVHPDIEWHTRWLGTPEVYRGHDGLRAFFAAIAEAWDDLRVEPERFVPVSDNRAVVIERLIGRGRGSGIEVDMHVYEAVTASDGLVLKRDVFYSLDEALAVFQAAD